MAAPQAKVEPLQLAAYLANQVARGKVQVGIDVILVGPHGWEI